MSTNQNHTPEEEVLKDQETEAAAENQEVNEEAQTENPTEELSAEEKLTKELEEAKQAVEEQKDKYLRLSAEFDNYRKRTLKEKAELIKNGGEKAISAIFPVLAVKESARKSLKMN